MNIEDAEQLAGYLRERGYLQPDEPAAMRILAGGVSNKTVLVKRAEGPDLVIKQALAKLRVKTDWFSDPARIYREAEGMRLLQQVAPEGAITPFVFEDKEHQLLGMEAVPEPHENWKQRLLQGKVDPTIVRQFGQCLGQIHRSFELAAYDPHGLLHKTDFFESLRIEPYYLFTAEQAPAAGTFLHDLVDETRITKLTLVHGDYSPKNILIHQGRLVLLDHEVIHIGDPAFDIGFSMTHLLSKAHHVVQSRQQFLKAARLYWSTYLAATESVSWLAGFESRSVRHTLGCLLARVAGRSPLEYLSDAEREQQRNWVIQLIEKTPDKMEKLFQSWAELLGS